MLAQAGLTGRPTGTGNRVGRSASRSTQPPECRGPCSPESPSPLQPGLMVGLTELLHSDVQSPPVKADCCSHFRVKGTVNLLISGSLGGSAFTAGPQQFPGHPGMGFVVSRKGTQVPSCHLKYHRPRVLKQQKLTATVQEATGLKSSCCSISSFWRLRGPTPGLAPAPGGAQQSLTSHLCPVSDGLLSVCLSLSSKDPGRAIQASPCSSVTSP